MNDEQLRDAITAHPTMQRLSTLCDQLEKVLKRKSAGASESDGADRGQTDREREVWKEQARKARAHDPHG